MTSEIKPVFYAAEERAFAPGIVKDWPKVIAHPTDKNGRLVRVSDDEARRFALSKGVRLSSPSEEQQATPEQGKT